MSGSTDGETRKQGRAIKRKIRMLRPRHGRMLMRPVHLQETSSQGACFFAYPGRLPEIGEFFERTPDTVKTTPIRDYTPPAGRKYLYTDDLERITGIPASTWKKWRSLKKGPPYRKFGGRVAYDPRDMEAWDEKQKVFTE